MHAFTQAHCSSLRRHASAALLACFGVLATFATTANAAAILSPGAALAGFGLSTFVSDIPNSGGVGPVGLVNVGSNIMLTGYATGEIRVFSDVDGQVWSAGAAALTNYGGNDPAGLATVGGKYYLARQANGVVVEVDAAGNYVQDIVSVGGLTTGLVGNPFTGHLFVSDVFGAVSDVDPIAKTKTTFISGGIDGITLSPDGKTLYVAALFTGHILGYDTTTMALVFDSGAIGGGIDGTALGSGSLVGNIFVNTNDGHVIEVNLLTSVQTVIVEGGSRGDLVTVDANNGTLLFTQTDRVLRLSGPVGGGFGNPIPEPSSLALIGLGLLALRFGRRR